MALKPKLLSFQQSRRTLSALLGGFLLLAGSVELRAQGCVVARGSGMLPGVSGERPEVGSWDLSVNYRYFKSDRHYTGTHEEEHRQEEGSQVINRSHFTDLSLTYTFNPRYSLTVTVPYVTHNRSQVVRRNDPQRTILRRFSTQSSGLGDLRATVNRWMWEPSHGEKGNVSLGLGLDLPTGNKDATDTFQVYDAASGQIIGVERTVDQSIQPGDGGYGVILDFYAYRRLTAALNLFANASYTVTPQETNDVPTYRSNPYEAIMGIADTYFVRAGAEYFVNRRIAISLGGRVEGVPVNDLIGGSDGFRRPGFSVAVEPGVSYVASSWAARLYVPVAVHRERSRSVPDKQQTAATGRYSHGDAAFADYLVMVSLSKRF